jgi:hypothetical protein
VSIERIDMRDAASVLDCGGRDAALRSIAFRVATLSASVYRFKKPTFIGVHP